MSGKHTHTHAYTNNKQTNRRAAFARKNRYASVPKERAFLPICDGGGATIYPVPRWKLRERGICGGKKKFPIGLKETDRDAD